MQANTIIRSVRFGEKRRCVLGAGTDIVTDFNEAKVSTLRYQLCKALDRLRCDYCKGDQASYNNIVDGICSRATERFERNLRSILTSDNQQLVHDMEDSTDEYMDDVLGEVLQILGDVNEVGEAIN